MPHYAYIQPGYIYSDKKLAFRELRRVHEAGEDHAQSEKLWKPKPVEELYDLTLDPDELHNLAGDPAMRDEIRRLHEVMHAWILDTRDTGYLLEPEMMIRSKGTTTPYEMAHDPEQYDLRRILDAAEMVGKGSPEEIADALRNPDSGVRFWAGVAAQARSQAEDNLAFTDTFRDLLDDPSPSVQIMVAETLCDFGHCDKALPVLEKWLRGRAAVAFAAGRKEHRAAG